MEQFERNCAENMRLKITEAELMLKDNHRQEVNLIVDRHRSEMNNLMEQMQSQYMPINEHETIVQQELDNVHDNQLEFIGGLKYEHVQEVEKLQNLVVTLENKLEWISQDYIKALENKDRTIQDLQ